MNKLDLLVLELGVTKKQLALLERQHPAYEQYPPGLATEGFIDILFGKKENKKDTAVEERRLERLSAATFTDGEHEVTGKLAVIKNSDKLRQVIRDLTALADVIPEAVKKEGEYLINVSKAMLALMKDKDVKKYVKATQEAYASCKCPTPRGWKWAIAEYTKGYKEYILLNPNQICVIGTTRSTVKQPIGFFEDMLPMDATTVWGNEKFDYVQFSIKKHSEVKGSFIVKDFEIVKHEVIALAKRAIEDLIPIVERIKTETRRSFPKEFVNFVDYENTELNDELHELGIQNFHEAAYGVVEETYQNFGGIVYWLDTLLESIEISLLKIAD